MERGRPTRIDKMVFSRVEELRLELARLSIRSGLSAERDRDGHCPGADPWGLAQTA